jgi:hypothetical protein
VAGQNFLSLPTVMIGALERSRSRRSFVLRNMERILTRCCNLRICNIPSYLHQRRTTMVESCSNMVPYLGHRWGILEGVVHDLSFARAASARTTFVDMRRCIMPLLPPGSILSHYSTRFWPDSAVGAVAARRHWQIETLEASLSRP